MTHKADRNGNFRRLILQRKSGHILTGTVGSSVPYCCKVRDLFFFDASIDLGCCGSEKLRSCGGFVAVADVSCFFATLIHKALV